MTSVKLSLSRLCIRSSLNTWNVMNVSAEEGLIAPPPKTPMASADSLSACFSNAGKSLLSRVWKNEKFCGTTSSASSDFMLSTLSRPSWLR